MNTTITIPAELANKIAERAAAIGLGLEEYAREVLGRDVETPTSDEPLAPVNEQPGATNGEVRDEIEPAQSSPLQEEQATANEGRNRKRPVRLPLIDASKELRWLKEHRHEHIGQWVALDGNRLLAHGTNAREVFRAAREAGVKAPFVEQILPADELPFGGW